jgi:hypothetical protein
VPVAELHYTKMYDKVWRMSIAERELDNLITNDIKPLFALLTKALEEIASTYWSFDGDFVHQLVDCVMLGPFAAADMMPAFRSASGRVFRVPRSTTAAVRIADRFNLQTRRPGLRFVGRS